MSTLFSRVVKQVFTTFDKQNLPTFKANLNVLKQLVDQLTAKDLHIQLEFLTEEAFSKPSKAPCTYVHIFRNDDVAMSVFILQGSYTMPLHDHPMMHGILKAIFGTLRIQSYTKRQEISFEKEEKYSRVKAEPEKIITTFSESATLTPTESNFHEITAVGGVAAFFDILSPPYEADIPIYGVRKCNFYKKVDIGLENELNLIKVPAPSSYYCDIGEYTLPEFFRQYENKKESNSRSFFRET